MSEMNKDTQLHNTKNSGMDIFFLTKPPNHDRTGLCWKLIAQSENAVLYLAGDGVYNLFCSAIKNLPGENILVCREDTEARGVQVEEKAVFPADFYERMAMDIMDETKRIFVF
ncbi:MAG: hypothetical protein SCH66_05040 [Methanolobus sp.]|nr:hypothetical protein [Methanolobus sp.]